MLVLPSCVDCMNCRLNLRFKCINLDLESRYFKKMFLVITERRDLFYKTY